MFIFKNPNKGLFFIPCINFLGNVTISILNRFFKFFFFYTKILLKKLLKNERLKVIQLRRNFFIYFDKIFQLFTSETFFSHVQQMLLHYSVESTIIIYTYKRNMRYPSAQYLSSPIILQ